MQGDNLPYATCAFPISSHGASAHSFGSRLAMLGKNITAGGVGATRKTFVVLLSSVTQDMQ